MNSIPETSPSPWPITRVGIKSTVWGVLFAGAVRGCYFVFEHHQLPALMAVMLILSTLGLGVVCVAYLFRWITGLDEMQQRIQLQALALVGPGILGIVLCAEMLRWAEIHDGISWNVRPLGVAMLISYSLAYAWYWSRNR